MAEKKIKTHGLELFMMGILVFVTIITLTIVVYKIFIKEQVKRSREYSAATYFLANSQTLKEYLLSPMRSMRFVDLQVAEKENYGICRIEFEVTLENNSTAKIEIGLVKISDFWVVYEALLNPHTPSAYSLVSAYQKILALLERLDFNDYRTAELYLDMIHNEVKDPRLNDYLTARVQAIAGNSTYAFQLLEDLASRVNYGRLAIWLEQGMIEFERERYTEATYFFEKIIHEYAVQKDAIEKGAQKSIFSGLPKDLFIATFAHDNILAETHKMLAETYRKTKDLEKSLHSADEAMKQAKQIGSSVVKSAALLVKAFTLFDLSKYKEADVVLQEVIHDVDNPNITQKAWAWYYRAQIAGKGRRDEDALDYYETAVNLDPYNPVFRKDTIDYLLMRDHAGDVEIALALALRGVDYEVEKAYFEDKVAEIYDRLKMSLAKGSL